MPNTQELTRLASEDSPAEAPPVGGGRTTGYALVRSEPLTEPRPGEPPIVPMPGGSRPPETPATLGDLARLEDRLLTQFDRAVVGEGRRLQERLASEMAVVVAASEERTRVLIAESEERTRVLIAESEARTRAFVVQSIAESEARTRAFVVESIRQSEERMKEFVLESIRQSEERMKVFVLDAVRQSEERMKDFMLECIRRSEERTDKRTDEVVRIANERMDRIDRRTNLLMAAVVVPAFAATIAFLHRWATSLF